MHRILEHIARREAEFAQHRFFRRLERSEPFERLAPVATGLSFWVLAFHDLLHLLEDRMVDPALAELVRHHVAEERGHDIWYLEDLATLGLRVPATVELFGAQHAAARRASYALMSEALRSEHDLDRVALLLVLESTGHVFFLRAAAYDGFPRTSRALRFFSGHHLQVEEAHELLERRMRAQLAEIALDAADAERIRAMCDRGYAAFDGMFDGLEAQIARLKPEERSIPDDVASPPQTVLPLRV